jgi:Tol biopolymer transport system component
MPMCQSPLRPGPDDAVGLEKISIVFYKEYFRPRDVDLYTMNTERTGAKPALTQITDYPGKEYSPDWSPDGDRIVFYQDTRTKGLRIFTIRPDGTDRQLVVQDGRDPVFSPDGRKIAFTLPPPRSGHPVLARSLGPV